VVLLDLEAQWRIEKVVQSSIDAESMHYLPGP